MRQMRSKSALFTLLLGFAPIPVVAQVGSTVPNWTVPPYTASHAEGGLTTMTDISPGIGFVAMQPCRVFDTRNASGPYGGPRLVANTTRNFDIDSGPCTPIPAGVEAYSMNFGAILPDGANSFITIWPTGSAQPLVSSINPVQGAVVANAAIVPAGAGGSISVFPNTGIHLYGDINGYFTASLNSGNQFLILANLGNQSALHVDNASSVGGSRAILGNASSTSGVTWGVVGHTNSPSAGSAGVRGVSLPTDGDSYGVQGLALNTNGSRASVGVYGIAGVDPDPPQVPAGVWGASSVGHGVSGTSSSFSGVVGVHIVGGNTASSGRLGYTSTTGVFAGGDIVATGTKFFVEPHPSDPTKQIDYISLEGPEAGTYFRGRGRFQGGLAVIAVPEDFRLVSDPDGLTVQVTPLGEMATVAVVSLGLDRIVVKASRDVEFFYLVNGVRAAFKDHRPITENLHYRPQSRRDRMLGAYSREQRRRLIATGIYNEDGSVNLETARRLGWDRIWEERSRPASEPAP